MKSMIRKALAVLLPAVCYTSCLEKVDPEPPTLSVVSVTGVGVNTANLSSAITKAGNQEILDHGFVFSQSGEHPAIDNTSIKKGAIDRATPTPITINGSLTGLKTAAEYYVWAYAQLQSGPVFSEAVKFKTSNVTQPGVKTEGYEAVTVSSARLKASITARGTYPVSEYGIVWGGASDPTTASLSRYSVKGDVGNVPFAFSANAAGLTANSTYHFRAYVISNGVTTYGADLSFKTSEVVQPGIRTDGASEVGNNSARLSGTVTGGGSHAISERGVVWGTGQNPTTDQAKASLSGNVTEFPSGFTVEARNLSPNTTYHYRAYVIANGVTSYGADKTFATGASLPVVVTNDAANLTQTSAVLNGSVNSGGSYAISEIGMVWSSTQTNPAVDNSTKASQGGTNTFPYAYNFTAGNLSPNTTYYYRAYVISNGIAYYGAARSFRTASVVKATVTTHATITSVSGSGWPVKLSGEVTKVGTYPVQRYGFQYSIGGTAFNAQTAKEVSGTTTFLRTTPFTFSNQISYRQCGSNLYFRAYVIDNAGNQAFGEIRSIIVGSCVN